MTFAAKVFMNGRSQAIALPDGFNFDCDMVYITREGNRFILETKPSDASVNSWADFHALGPCPDFEIDRRDSPEDNRICFA